MPTFSRNIIISIALAIAAAGALLAYTQQVRDSATQSTHAVSVIVATHEITVGTTVDEAQSKGYLATQAVRESDLADGAIRSFDGIGGQVITENLYRGDQLTANRVGQPKSQTTTFKVTGKFRAIRVPFNPNSGLLTDVHTGDHVDVLTSYRKGDEILTYMAVPNALVLDVLVPGSDSGLATTSTTQGSVLLSVTEQQSLYIANALANAAGGQAGSNIWLTAVGASGATYEPIQVASMPGGTIPNHGLPVK
jgi:Flp pilus assembly protein CpaB